MIFGFSTYGMKGIATEKALPILSEIGFNAVELAVWEGWDASPDNMNGERRNTIRDLSKDHGIRIDHLLLSPPAADRLIDADIDAEPRDREKPSDHVPVWCKLED